MNLVRTSIPNTKWDELKIIFKGRDTKVYYKDREIKKIMDIQINSCEVLLEHALLEETYEIFNGRPDTDYIEGTIRGLKDLDE